VLWSLWAVVVVAATCVGVLGWAAAVVARQRAEGAADLAALAAARALVAGDEPCSSGSRVAVASGARLVACTSSGTAVTIVVEIAVPPRALLGLDLPPARARARAGVPP
jgi:secretion/DNA translocation related TadE-like protein